MPASLSLPENPAVPVRTREAAAEGRLRIALVCDWYLPRIGGIERHLAALADQLHRAGHEITVVTPMPETQVAAGLRSQRVPTSLLPGATVMWSPRGFRHLGRLLRAGDFDVIHAHLSILSPAAIAAVYHAQKTGLPTLSTTHSVLGRFAPVFGWLHRRFGWGAWPVVYSGVSERVARDLQPYVPRPVTVLPNAVDPRAWPAVQRLARRDAVAIACVMRLVPRKRGEILLRALANVKAQLGDRRVVLHFAGDGPARRALERLTAHLGLTAMVRFHGSLQPPAIKRLLAEADFFALPCRLEAFGIAALEARATGLPVLAMAESGVAEFVKHGTEGLLARDDAEFTRHLFTLCTDDAFRAQLGAHNVQTPIKQTWDTLRELHLRAYAEARTLCARVGDPAATQTPRA